MSTGISGMILPIPVYIGIYKRNKTIREYHTEYLYTYLYIYIHRQADWWKEKTICNISIVWEKNLQTGGDGGGGTRCNSSCDAVLYIIPAVLDQMTTFPRNDSPIRSLCGTHRRLSLHLSTKHTHTHTHTPLVIFIDAMFLNVIFFSFTL